MALPIFQRTVVNEAGDIIPSAQIEVRLESTDELATVYSDRDGLIELSNPFFADSSGLARFYCNPNEYKITATGNGQAIEWRYVVIIDTNDVAIIGDNILDINLVADDIADVSTVADNILDVNIVADDIAVLNNISDNMAEILEADTNAATATTQAGIATTQATNASASATAASNSATAAAASATEAEGYRDTVVAKEALVSPHYDAIDSAYTNIAAIIDAPNQATTATTQAGIATTQATNASASATAAAGSAISAQSNAQSSSDSAALAYSYTNNAFISDSTAIDMGFVTDTFNYFPTDLGGIA